MRTNKELLEKVIKCWESGYDYNKFGICYCVSEMMYNEQITDLEHDKILRYIKINRPTKKRFPKFFIGETISSYWWNIRDKEVRLCFLYSLSLKLNNNN